MAKSKHYRTPLWVLERSGRVLDGLDPAEAVQQSDGGSSYAWTVAHLQTR